MNKKREFLDKIKRETYKVNAKSLTKTPQEIERALSAMQNCKYSDIKQIYTHIRKGV